MSATWYENNSPMRKTFFRMNDYTHVEIYETYELDEPNEPVIYPMLTSGEGIGSVEFGSPCYTLGQIEKWRKRYAPELSALY